MAERMEPNVAGSLGPSVSLAQSPRAHGTAQASVSSQGTGMKEACGSRQDLDGRHETRLRSSSRKSPCAVTKR